MKSLCYLNLVYGQSVYSFHKTSADKWVYRLPISLITLSAAILPVRREIGKPDGL